MADLTTSIRIRAGVDGLSDIEALTRRLAETGVNTDELANRHATCKITGMTCPPMSKPPSLLGCPMRHNAYIGLLSTELH